MTTKTEINLPPLPDMSSGALKAAFEEYARAAVEADRKAIIPPPMDYSRHDERYVNGWNDCRAEIISNAGRGSDFPDDDDQDHIGGGNEMVPSDDEIVETCKALGWDLDAQEERDMILLARTVLSRYSSCQPAASATPSDDDLLGCAGVSTNGGLPSIVGTADIRRFADCVRKHWGQIVGSVAQEPVGVVNMAGPMYVHGTTIVTFEAEKVPVGTKLYAAPVAAQAQPMVDMLPPATSRDRWMYQQGRLAERDPRTPGSLAAEVAAQDRGDALIVAMQEAVDLLGPNAPSCCGCEYEWNHALRVLRAAIDAARAKEQP